jgi:hypothetical protein
MLKVNVINKFHIITECRLDHSGCLHGCSVFALVYVGSVADVQEVHAASIYRVTMSKISFYVYIGFSLTCPQEEGWGLMDREMEGVHIPPKCQQHCPYHRMQRAKNKVF